MSAPSPDPTSNASSLPTVINPIQFHYSINPKLIDSNFLLWKSQVLPIIRGHGLLSFLESSSSAASSTLTASPAANSSDLTSDMWQRQDQLILAWLLSSLGPDILPQAIGCETSADLWRMLHSTYSAHSTSRMLELKLQLQTLKKGSQSCTEYLNRLKSVALQLRSIGCAVSDQDLSLSIFAGLPPEYNSLVTSLTSQSATFSIAELHSHLLNFESRLASQDLCDHAANLTLGDSFKTAPPTSFNSNGAGSDASIKPVNSSSISPSPLLPTPLPAGFSSSSSPNLSSVLTPALLSTLPWQTQQHLAAAYISQQLSKSNYRGGRGRGRNRGRGRGYSQATSQGRWNASSGGHGGTAPRSNTGTLQCQICMKFGHTAKSAITGMMMILLLHLR